MKAARAKEPYKGVKKTMMINDFEIAC